VSRKLVINDGRTERELLVVGTMVVGRDPECEISSSDPRLSRRHAEVRATPEGVVVRDLGSRNGLGVNNTPTSEKILVPGAVVQVAHLSLRFVDDAESVTPPPRSAPFAVSAPPEDDRTRALPPGALQATAMHTAPMPVAVSPSVVDDRTRVLPPGARARAAPAPTEVMSAMPSLPADAGEVVIRETGGSGLTPRASSAAVAPGEDLHVQALVGVGWGRRVLVQGLVLSLVVFLMTAIPLLAWQARVFGATALQAWAVLLPPLGAAVFAGIMVAALIARTAVRGAQQDGRD